MIPDGWKETTLGEAMEIYKSPWKPGNRTTKYIGLEHINQNDLSINGYGSSAKLESNKFIFNKGDILFGKLRPYFRKVWKAKFDGICSTDIWVLRAKEKYDQQYLFYFIANPAFIEKTTGASTGTRMPRADWSFLKNTLWHFPPLPEQKAIADVLSSFDNKIELLREQNKTLEAIAQTIFDEWFVRFNFPDENGKPYQVSGGKMIDSELGPIPEGWRVGKLTEIANFLNGLALQNYPPENGTAKFPVVKIKEMKTGITEQTELASCNIASKYIIDTGDVLFSWSGSLEIEIWKYGKGALNQHIFKVSSDFYPKWFYLLWIKEHLPRFQQIAKAKAVTMGHIKRHHLEDALVFIPDKSVIARSDRVLKRFMDKSGIINSQIQTISALRDELLLKLMKGEIRIKGANI